MNKSAQAYRRIKQLIEEGHFPFGERLTEAKAANMVGLGRAPVRESLVRLEAEGLLQNRGTRRSRVIAYTDDQNPRDMLHRYEIRERIESAAAALAAKNMTGWQIDRLRELARTMEETQLSDDLEARYEASNKFRHFLLANCGNPLLLDVWQTHRLAPSQPRSQELNDRISAEAAKGDRRDNNCVAVVDAIAARDADRAEMILKKRIRAVTEAIRKIVLEDAEDGMPDKLPHIEELAKDQNILTIG